MINPIEAIKNFGVNTFHKYAIRHFDNDTLCQYIIDHFSDAESIIKVLNIYKEKLNGDDIVKIIVKSDLSAEERVKVTESLDTDDLDIIISFFTSEEKILFQRNQIRSMMEFVKDDNFKVDKEVLKSKLEKFVMNLLISQLVEMEVHCADDRVKFIVDSECAYRGNFNVSWISNQNGSFDRIWGYDFNLFDTLNSLESAEALTRVESIKDLCVTVFHEVQHHRQELMMSKCVSNKKSIAYAQGDAMRTYLGEKFYKENYVNVVKESEAFFVGHTQLRDILGEIDVYEEGRIALYSKIFEVGKYIFEYDTATNKHWSSNGNTISRDDATIKILDSLPRDIMKRLLIKYPILQKQYNMDGSRKMPIDLVNSMNGEVFNILKSTNLSDDEKKKSIKDAQEMYYELVYKALEIASPEQISELRQQMGEDKCRSFFDRMSLYFEDEFARKLKVVKDLAQHIKESYYENKEGIVVLENGTKISINEFIDNIPSESLPQVSQSSLDTKAIVKKYIAQYINLEGRISVRANIHDLSCTDGEEITIEKFCEMHLHKLVNESSNYLSQEVMTESVRNIMLPNAWIQYNKDKTDLQQYYENRQKNISEVCRVMFENDKGKKVEYSPVLSEAVKLTESECTMDEICADANKVVQIEKYEEKSEKRLENSLSR